MVFNEIISYITNVNVIIGFVIFKFILLNKGGSYETYLSKMQYSNGRG